MDECARGEDNLVIFDLLKRPLTNDALQKPSSRLCSKIVSVLDYACLSCTLLYTDTLIETIKT